MRKLEIAENVFIYYGKDEKWEFAIRKHPVENSGFRIVSNKVRYGEQDDESSKYVCFGGGKFQKAGNPISNDDCYLSDEGPSNE